MKSGFYGYRGVDPRAGRTPAGAPVASTNMMSLVAHAVAANDVPSSTMLDHPPPIGASGQAAVEESMFDKLGPWLWIAPASVVAIGLVAYFIKRKSLGGYRRRRRSRR